jgi:hypothetical protein
MKFSMSFGLEPAAAFILALFVSACATTKQTGHEFVVNEAAKAQAESVSKDCDGTPNGVAIWGYQQPSVTHGSMCIPSTKTCIDGTWTGPEVFAACTELPE